MKKYTINAIAANFRLKFTSLLLLGLCGKALGQDYNTPVTLSSGSTTGNYISTVSITLGNGFTSTGPFSATIQPQPNPSLNQNYIITFTPRVPLITTSVGLNAVYYDKTQIKTDIQYFDGLGRPMQTVQVKGSPTGKDIVQPQAYDQLGREVLKYLPYGVSPGGLSDGSYKSTAVADQLTFYNPPGSTGAQLPGGVARITSPYSGVNYEPSPLNRPVEQGAPGDPWQLTTSGVSGSGHTVTIAYGTNVGSDVINWTVATGGATGSTYYAANALYTTTTADEMGNKTIQYKDVQGRLVCKRAQNSSTTYLSTYYVFDDFNQLAYVIPPIPAGTPYPTSFLETDAIFSNFIYGYHYDARHRLTEKSVPGKGWEYYVYNTIDKMVASQDAVQRGKATQEWTFTKYDEPGRPVLTGVYQYSGSTPNTSYRVALQGTVTGQTTLWETPTGTGTGYTTAAWPISWTGSTLTISYYDNYTKVPSLPTSYGAPTGYNASTRGLVTASLTNVLGTTNLLWNVNYYDGLGRLMKNYKQHYYGGVASLNNYDVNLPTYDFTNAITGNTRQHYINNTGNTLLLNAAIANTYVYDHEGRKVQTQEQINGGTNVILSQLVYNEVGQVYKKQLHSEDNGSNFIEQVAYSYNPRGWLTEINSPNFDEKLYYESPSGTIAGLTGLYNGNILEAWYNSPYVSNKGFAYGYDNLNRLLTSKYYSGSSYSGALDETITYDYMGNITQLIRGSYGTQSYTYSGTFAYTSYTGNRVNTITNNGAAYRSYGYDNNGNATTVGSFGYDYNMLNLPADVKLSGTIFNTYTYDATGQKLRKVSTASGFTTDYISGVQYKNAAVDFIETEEGRFTNLSSPVYQYALKDHLGNVRAVIQKSTASSATLMQANEYYAFGLNVTDYDNSTQNKYLYNKKELQDENNLNVLDYGARFYEPVVARWNVVDRFAEKYSSVTPYQYASNNPISFIDLHGDSVGVDKSITTNKQANKDFNNFANSKAGRKFLSNYAAKGQTIAGYTFTKNGVYNNKGVDLKYTLGKLSYNTQGQTFSNDASLPGTIVGDRLKEKVVLDYSRSPTGETGNDLSLDMTKVIFHESFVHVNLDTQDYLDDHLLNGSNLTGFAKDLFNIGKGGFAQHAQAIQDSPKSLFFSEGYPALQTLNQSLGTHYSDQKLKTLFLKGLDE